MVECLIEGLMLFVDKVYINIMFGEKVIDKNCIVLSLVKFWEEVKSKYYEEIKMDLDLEELMDFFNFLLKEN